MPLNPIPMPIETPLVEKDRTMSWKWVENFTARNEQLQQAAKTVIDTTVVPINALDASIAATALNIGSSGGFYRLNIYARITRAAGVSSSLTVTIAWTEGGQALTKAYALTANTVTTFESSVLPITVDATTSLTYATTYATAGAPTMLYGLRVAVERLA